MPSERRRVFSIGAWNPGLRTLVNSCVEPCGCLIGVYQGWGGNTMSVIDLPHPGCTQGHRQGDVVVQATGDSRATTTAERR